MSKRVSVKGKGADIFFGEYVPPAPPESTHQTMTAIEGTEGTEGADATTSASNLSRGATSPSRNRPLNPAANSTPRPITKPKQSNPEQHSQGNSQQPRSPKQQSMEKPSAKTNASKNVRMQVSKNASIEAGKQADEQASNIGASQTQQTIKDVAQTSAGALSADTLNAIWQYMGERATVTNAFRYTDQELSWLTDAIYEINKRHGVKLTKQDIARLGLNAILWDYRVRGDDSLLGEFTFRRKRGRSG